MASLTETQLDSDSQSACHLLYAAFATKAHLTELARLRDEGHALGKYEAAISAEHKRGMALGYYIERRESGVAGVFTAKTREEADRVLEETIAKIAAKQAIERAKAKPKS